MTLHKVTVGLQQKIGQPNFGSIGASCVVEVQLDDHEASDADAINQRIRQAFARCRRSLDEELQQAKSAAPVVQSPVSQGPPRTSAGSAGRGHRPATEKQIRAIQTICSKQGIMLASELEARFQVTTPDRLSIGQASTLIDALKSNALAS